MKKRKICFVFSLTLILALLLSCSITVFAGASYKEIVNNNDFSSGMNLGEIYLSDNAIVGKKEGIVFGETLGSGSRLAMKTQLFNPENAVDEECFTATFSFNIKKQIAGKIVISFGLNLPSSEMGAANTSAVWFSIQNAKLVMGVSNYDAAEDEIIILSSQDVGIEWSDAGINFLLDLKVTQGSGIELKINNEKTFEKADAKVATTGYIGVGITQEGNLFSIGKIRVAGYSNFTPENPNILEKFDKNCFNVNDLRTIIPLGAQGMISPKEGKLKFEDVTQGFITTRNIYSNVEVAFDITEMCREAIYDAENNLVRPISSGLYISIGCKADSGVKVESAYTFKFVPMEIMNAKRANGVRLDVYSGENLTESINMPKEYDIWNTEVVNNRKIGIVLTVKDGVITLGIRFDDEIGYTPIYKMTKNETPNGYIRIGAEGTPVDAVANLDSSSVRKCNFAIDNLSVTNMDSKARIVVTDYAPSRNNVSDYEDYVDSWNDDDMLLN